MTFFEDRVAVSYSASSAQGVRQLLSAVVVNIPGDLRALSGLVVIIPFVLDSSKASRLCHFAEDGD